MCASHPTAERLRCWIWRIFVRIKESVIRSAMSSLVGLYHTFSLSVHNTKHHLDSTTFSKTTVCTENLFQKLPGRKATPKKTLSHINCESGGNLRPNTPTGFEPNKLTTKELSTIPMMSLEEDIYQFSMYRKDLENKINQLQLLKK